MERICTECSKPIKGRPDKKFCDDFCRNAFNNRRNSDQNNLVRNINNTLRRNRRVLESLIPQGEETLRCSRRRLIDMGFDFLYHTHRYTSRKGNEYLFCYEFGYLNLDSEWLLLVRRNSELALSS